VEATRGLCVVFALMPPRGMRALAKGPTFRLSHLATDFIIPHRGHSAPSAELSVGRRGERTLGRRLSLCRSTGEGRPRSASSRKVDALATGRRMPTGMRPLAVPECVILRPHQPMIVMPEYLRALEAVSKNTGIPAMSSSAVKPGGNSILRDLRHAGTGSSTLHFRGAGCEGGGRANRPLQKASSRSGAG
jgi:hypothetical protein